MKKIYCGILLFFMMLTAHARAELRYTLAKPASDWTGASFNDSAWTAADDFSKIPLGNATEVWVRLSRDLTRELINNTWFRASFAGHLDVYVNGARKQWLDESSAKMRDYVFHAPRAEKPGPNLFAVHYKGKSPLAPLAFEIVSTPPVPVEIRVVTPADVLDCDIRDAQVALGSDGFYYMTGTTGDATFFKNDEWLRNPGIQLFRSADLKHFTSIGHVWTFEKNATWGKDIGTFSGRGPARAIFAPEVHFLDDKVYLPYSVNHRTPTHTFGLGIAMADKPEGPYRELAPERPLADAFDATLFKDDDGAVYLLWQYGMIARLKPDLSGLAEEPRLLSVDNYPRVGFEGVTMFKDHGKYFLGGAEFNLHADRKQSYDAMIAVADNIYGPYGPRHLAIRYGGHNGYFKGKDGKWRATVWNLPGHFMRPTITAIEITPDHIVRPVKNMGNRENQ